MFPIILNHFKAFKRGECYFLSKKPIYLYKVSLKKTIEDSLKYQNAQKTAISTRLSCFDVITNYFIL